MTDDQREELLDGWERVASGWGRQAERFSAALAPVTDAMLDRADLSPGRRVIELAAGPGDLSLAAAGRVAPTKVLCTDGVEAMLEVARERAREAGIDNIEFSRAQLEWIDLPAATAEVILCRFGLMLAVDPEAALRECRRVLSPGGRLVAAVQAAATDNPWVTAPGEAARALGLLSPPVPGGPGPFALADRTRLAGLIEAAGFLGVEIVEVGFTWRYANELDWIGQTIDHSAAFAPMWRELDDERRGALRRELGSRAAAFRQADGALEVPGIALVVVGDA